MEGDSVQDMQHLADVASPSASKPASLPVLDSVSNYEKIQRIGEGTYGVVCKPPSSPIAEHCQHPALADRSCYPQTRPGTAAPARLWP